MNENVKRGIAALAGLLLLSGCEEQSAPSTRADAVTAPKTATTSSGPAVVESSAATAAPSGAPSAAPAPVASTAGSASAAPASSASPATEPATLLANIAKASKVKVRRLDPGGGGSAVMIDDAEQVKRLLKAVGTDQTAVDLCPRCIPSVQLAFEDAFGTRLGTVGLFCSDHADQPAVAALRDALANTCQTLTVAEPDELRRILQAVLPALADAG